MLRVSAVLLFAARCAAFGTLPFSGPGGSCVDEPAHRVADETAKMGEPFAQLTSCDAIAQVGGCGREDAKAVCCATCALPQRMTYSLGAHGNDMADMSSTTIDGPPPIAHQYTGPLCTEKLWEAAQLFPINETTRGVPATALAAQKGDAKAAFVLLLCNISMSTPQELAALISGDAGSGDAGSGDAGSGDAAP